MHAHHDLKSVEAASLRYLDLAEKLLRQILRDNSVGGGEERQEHRQEGPLFVIQLRRPVNNVGGGVPHDFFGSPKRQDTVLVGAP